MRKLLALLLTLAMVLSLASVAVVATEEPVGTPVSTVQGLRDMTAAGGPYYLADDITITSGEAQVVFQPGIVLDGNGHAILFADDYAWSTTVPFDLGKILDTEDSNGDGSTTDTLYYPTPTVFKNLSFGKETDYIDLATTASNGSYTTALFNQGSSKAMADWLNVDFYVAKAESEDGHGITYTMPIMHQMSGVHNFTDCDIYVDINAVGQTAAFLLGNSGTWVFTNCTLNGSFVSSDGAAMGGFIKENSGGSATFINCVNNLTTFTAAGAGASYFGGFVGNAKAPTTLINCVNNANITTERTIGGAFVGRSSTTSVIMDGCVNNGNITYSGAGVTSRHGFGGFAGHMSASTELTFKNCINKGNITGPSALGGILGNDDNQVGFTMTNCINIGDVKTVSGVGSYTVGGLVGVNTRAATLTNCANYGAISNTGSAPSGSFATASAMVGLNWANLTLNNCVNYGSVYSSVFAAGMLAEVSATVTLNNCINYGTITSGHTVGGFLGQLKSGANADFNTCLNAGTIGNHGNNEGVGGFIGRLVGTNSTVTIDDSVNVGVIKGGSKCNTQGTYGDTFGQFIGMYQLNHSANGHADITIGGFFDWSLDGMIKPALTNCYVYGVSEVADGAVSLHGWVTKDDEGTLIQVADRTKPTLAVTEAPGACGVNVEFTGTAIEYADGADVTLNNLKLFPVTFKENAGGTALEVDTAPALKGYQQTADKKTIRFAATLNDLASVTSAGFTYTVKVNGVTKIDNVSKNVNQVLYSVNETNAGVTSKVLAANNGGQYFYTLTFVNVPQNATVEFTVQATVNGVAQGEAVTLTFVNGVYQAPQA